MAPSRKKKKNAEIAEKPLVTLAQLELENQEVMDDSANALAHPPPSSQQYLYQVIEYLVSLRTEQIKALIAEVENLSGTLASFQDLEETKPQTACQCTQTSPAPSCKETSSQTKPATPAPTKRKQPEAPCPPAKRTNLRGPAKPAPSRLTKPAAAQVVLHGDKSAAHTVVISDDPQADPRAMLKAVCAAHTLPQGVWASLRTKGKLVLHSSNPDTIPAVTTSLADKLQGMKVRQQKVLLPRICLFKVEEDTSNSTIEETLLGTPAVSQLPGDKVVRVAHRSAPRNGTCTAFIEVDIDTFRALGNRGRIVVDGVLLNFEESIRARLCFRCCGFGHNSAQCTRDSKCFHCGAVNVYNKFIPDYARLRTPLNNLLKKDVTWDWDDKCQKAFTSLKESLTQHPVLHLYKDELPCQVYCDASTLGIAGVLKQVHPAGKAYPVQYFSRALRVHERNYTISELECLAIVESVEKFRVYLMGRKFTIFSDHHALQWLKTIKNPSGRLFRWSLRLSCYEYEVRYIKGALQHEADLLSRNPFCGFLDATLLKNHQLTPSGESKLTIDRNGLQTLKRRGVTKIVVPDALVPDLLTKVHSRYNHPGISQMTRLISPQYYWKGMSEDISKTTKACAICQSTKPPRGPTFGELGQLPVATQPFDLVALDTIAGLAKYGNAKAYLHVVVDHFSRYTWTFPSKSTSITTYQQVIKRVLQDGSPKRLLTDRAPAFTSPKFRKFLINRNIHPLLTTSKLRLLHLENPKAAWTKLAKRVTVVYNNTPHSVTGFPPGYLMFGVLPPELTEHVNPYPVLTTARRIAHERTQAKHLKDKHAYDQQHKTPHFEPGDLVLVKVYHHPNTGKLAPYFTGPYEILEIISPNVVRINRPNQPLNRNTDTVHVNKLQYYNENIRYIAPPTLIPHPAKPQSRTLPPLFEHLTPDLFTVERFAPTIGNCTTTTPVDPQCNIIAQRDIPQPAISRPTHITKVKNPIPTVRADPKPIPLQARTISRRLVANGLHSCRPLRRLPLTPPNRRQRLEWCRARSTWMTEWHRVVFSDESRFCLSSDSRRVRVWRRRGERSNPAAIVERPTVRQRGIMVWGAIAYDSRSPLLRIQGTMTAQRYVDDVLRPVTLPYLQGVPNALYQQDNARPHTARISQQALQDVQMLPWPPYSPDLSPIEHVWDIIGRCLHALPQPRSEDETVANG
ncbi:hypothetical protein LAZ67_12001877 [Cordylochernes scorpioides]|uniref:RNA-directed DNA polymerase n=1 Tax=Cordylochernes scorpioides TaxID=51811 RepID=A0ABY6L3B1_9ARAC|nr:hypothetical protein LAZ67_12001877 [Cordylochernes scorpioides]